MCFWHSPSRGSARHPSLVCETVSDPYYLLVPYLQISRTMRSMRSDLSLPWRYLLQAENIARAMRATRQNAAVMFCVNGVTPKKSLNTKMPRRMIRRTPTRSVPRSVLSGREMRRSSAIPTRHMMLMHIVEYWLADQPRKCETTIRRIIEKTVVTEAGRDRARTFVRKLPLMRS